VYVILCLTGQPTSTAAVPGTSDITQMTHGSEWTLKFDEPEVENDFQPRVITFQCRTNDRALSVLSNGQPLAFNCISSSETVAKRDWVSSAISNAHRPNCCSWLAVCVN